MATDQRGEPTPTEIVEEIRKWRDETTKRIEGSSIAVWLTPTGLGASIALFGLARSVEVGLRALGDWLPFVIAGLALMFWARVMATRAQQRFKDKWGEPPPKF